MIPRASELLALALAASLGLAGMQTVRLASERAERMRTVAAHAQQLQRIAEATTKTVAAVQLAQRAHQWAVAAIDTQRTKELNDALAENDSLRARTVRLRIPAICPGSSAPASLPGAATAPSMDAQAADLTAEAGQAVLDLRAALITERAQLLALQDYARQCSAPGDKPHDLAP